jgi:hypothetical protein
MTTIDGGDVLGRVSSAARAIHRFSTWGAGAGLAVGAVAFLSLAPWLADLGSWALPLGALLAAVLVAAPLRVSWHGHKIGAAYGDPAHIEYLLDEIPGAIDEVVRELQAVAAPQGRGLRRVVSAWRSLLAVRAVVQDSPARERADVLVDPLRPEALGLTTTALWATIVTLVLGVPVALVSLVALALT